METTQITQITTKKGNTIQLFYDNETGTLVVDLVAANKKGGNEIVRMSIDENKLLAHTIPKPRKPRSPRVTLS